MGEKTAVIVIHGIGEQIPMETLTGFVDTVWTSDPDLRTEGKPDPNTGYNPANRANVSWAKPDRRNRTYELQRITTEEARNGHRFDFYEYYWAHRIQGTTWKQVQTWFLDLMWRNPFTNIPKGLHLAWAAMWAIAIIVAGVWIWWLFRDDGAEKSPWITLALAVALAVGAVVISKIVSYVGDVVRYVKAKPENIAIRQEVRENGVRLLDELLGVGADGKVTKSDYDRIIMVGHSLGTIVAYDILTHSFARHNTRFAPEKVKGQEQPARAALEELLRENLADREAELDLETFRGLQDACRKELLKAGGLWTVSDFVTMGSPLAHAEFLMARNCDALREAQERRVLPTCPPQLEYDGKTKLQHFTFRPSSMKKYGEDDDPLSPRVPHHAALFAYTRWTNIYSPHSLVVLGDLISGKLGKAFGLVDAARRKGGDGKPEGDPVVKVLVGAKDIAVLPADGEQGLDGKSRIFTHLSYWNRDVAAAGKTLPYHIKKLREALRLGEN